MGEAMIWCDGACSGNPGSGGWAALIRRGQKEIYVTGNNPQTTNNQMELCAVIGALEMLNDGEQACVFSDSQYVVNGITTWIKKWKKNNWISSTSKSRVINKELWEKLDALVLKHKVKFKWIRGHSTIEIDYVDKLAKQQINRGM